MPYIKITPQGLVAAEHAAANVPFLKVMQKEVGGHIEPVYRLLSDITDRVPDAVMIVNEEALLTNLRFNPLATVLAGEQLFGTVLLLKVAVVNDEGEQDIVELTKEEAQKLMKYLGGEQK